MLCPGVARMVCAVIVVATSSSVAVRSPQPGKRDIYSELAQTYGINLHGSNEAADNQAVHDPPKIPLTQQQIGQLLDDILYHSKLYGQNQAQKLEEQHDEPEVKSSHEPIYPPYPVAYDQLYQQFAKPFFTAIPLTEKPLPISDYLAPVAGQHDNADHSASGKFQQVPLPYPITTVHVEKQVPVEKPVPYPVPVKAPYPVSVPQPYPVPVEKPIPYPVVKPIPYPVHYPVPVEKYNPAEAFKANHEAFSHPNHYQAIQGYPLHPPTHYPKANYHIPDFGHFPLDYHHHHYVEDDEDEDDEDSDEPEDYHHRHKGKCPKKKTTKKPTTTTTTKKPTAAASIFAFLLKNLSSS